MPRKGWSTAQVPDGWLQVIRGPRPQSVKWPAKGQQKPNLKVRDVGKVRQDSLVGQQVPRVQRGEGTRVQVGGGNGMESPTRRVQGCKTL